MRRVKISTEDFKGEDVLGMCDLEFEVTDEVLSSMPMPNGYEERI